MKHIITALALAASIPVRAANKKAPVGGFEAAHASAHALRLKSPTAILGTCVQDVNNPMQAGGQSHTPKGGV